MARILTTSGLTKDAVHAVKTYLNIDDKEWSDE